MSGSVDGKASIAKVKMEDKKEGLALALENRKRVTLEESSLAVKQQPQDRPSKAPQQAAGQRFLDVLAECRDPTLTLKTLEQRETLQYTRISEKKIEIARIESLLAEKQLKEETLQKSLASLQEELQQHDKSVRAKKDRLHEIESRLKEKENTLEAMKEKQYQSETERCRLELHLRQFQMEHLRIKVGLFSSRVDENLLDALETLEKSIAKAEITLAMSEKRLDEFAKNVLMEEKNLRACHLDFTRAAIEVSEAQRQAATSKESILQATSDLNYVQKTIQRMEEDRLALQDKLIRLGIDVASVQSQKVILKAQQEYDQAVQLVLAGAVPSPSSFVVGRLTAKGHSSMADVKQQCAMAPGKPVRPWKL